MLDELLMGYDIDPTKISKETRNKLLNSRKAVSEFFEGGTNFEHTLPKSLIKYIDDPEKKVELLLTGSRTSPELNQFKLRSDRKLNGAVSRLKGTSKDKVKYSLKEYNDEVKRIRAEVREATGGYEIGYLKFDKNGNATAVLPKNSKSLLKTKDGLGPETYQKLSVFENAKYHNNLIKNYNKSPNSEIFNTLKEYEPDPTKLTLYKDQQKAYEQVNKYLKISKQKFLNFANKNIDNPVVQAIFKAPYGKAAAVTTAAIIPQKLSAETGVIDKAKSWPVEHPWLTGGAGVAATAATKTGRKLLGKVLNLATGPTGMGALTYAFRPDDGYDLSRTGDRLGFEVEAALAPTLVKGVTDVTSKFKNPLLRKGIETLAGVRIPGLINPANVLKAARVASPIGIASLAGEGLYHLGKKGYEQRKLMETMTEEEKRDFLSDQYENLGGVFGEGA